eukprot:14682205-Heterocapsa_arctica.AAC.1
MAASSGIPPDPPVPWLPGASLGKPARERPRLPPSAPSTWGRRFSWPRRRSRIRTANRPDSPPASETGFQMGRVFLCPGIPRSCVLCLR